VDKQGDLSRAIFSLAKDSLTDEYDVRNIVTAIYALADSVALLAKAVKENKDA
jgi:hypothetical protein